MSGEIVPFGKYKGKPVEVLTHDRQYVDWLTTQPWFKERFCNLYTVIVNNFQEPAATPEHNALQARFLDLEFRRAFLFFLEGKKRLNEVVAYEFEPYGCDVLLADRFAIEIKPTVGDDYPAIIRKFKQMYGGILPVGQSRFCRCRWVLFLEEYVGVGATMEQFIAVCESAEIAVVFLDEVLAALDKL